jgi:Haloacid dehalogenase-like hydrolase
LLTHSPSEYARTLMRRFRMRVDATVTGSDGYAPKPDPTGLRAVAEDLGVAPSACIYVGDSVGDFGAAAAAGMLSVGVAWSGGSRPGWRHGWPDVAIKRPGRLLELLDGESGLPLLGETLIAGEVPRFHWGSVARLGDGEFALGRYFTTSDRRAARHGLSDLVLRAKDDPAAAEEVAEICRAFAAGIRARRPPHS